MNQMHKKWFILTIIFSIFVTATNINWDFNEKTALNLQTKNNTKKTIFSRKKRQPLQLANSNPITINLGQLRNNESETIRTAILNNCNPILFNMIENGFDFEIENITPTTAGIRFFQNQTPIPEDQVPNFIINFNVWSATFASIINVIRTEGVAIPLFITRNLNFTNVLLESDIRNVFLNHFLNYVLTRWNCHILHYEDDYGENKYEIISTIRHNLLRDFTTFTARIRFNVLNETINLIILSNESIHRYLYNLHSRINTELGTIPNNRKQTILKALARANPGCTVLPIIIDNLSLLNSVTIETTIDSAIITFPSIEETITFTVNFRFNPHRLADIRMIDDLGIITDNDENTILNKFRELNPHIDMKGIRLWSVTEDSAKLKAAPDNGSSYKGVKKITFKLQHDQRYYEYSVAKNSKNQQDHPTPPPDGSCEQISSHLIPWTSKRRKEHQREQNSSTSKNKHKVTTSNNKKTWASKIFAATNLGEIKDNMPKTILENFYKLNNINAATRKNIKFTKIQISKTTARLFIAENATFFEEKLTLNFRVKAAKDSFNGKGIWIGTGVTIGGGAWLLAKANSLRVAAKTAETIPLLTNSAAVETGTSVAVEEAATTVAEVGASLAAEETAVVGTSAALGPETGGASIVVGILLCSGIMIHHWIK